MSEQVLVTGISGFIGKHVALALLRRGQRVRGTVRTAARADEVQHTLEAQGVDLSAVEIVEADLGSDSGWGMAAEGCTYVQHVASPFPIVQPRDREALVPAAREGALRVLEAARAADVEHIVFTSSMVAMMYRPDRPKTLMVQEDDWTDPEWKKLSAYIVSKTRAERAAWQWADKNGWNERLTVINPGFVLGPTVDDQTNTSLDVIKLIMEGAYPAVPPVSFPIVDVRDLAELHCEAMTVPGLGGRRLIGATDTLAMSEMGAILRQAFPDRARRIPTRVLPAFFVRMLSIFDRSLKSVLSDLNVVPQADSEYVSDLTGVRFRAADEAVRAAGQSLVDHSLLA
jgi:dihydroflavonol-4-reductase